MLTVRELIADLDVTLHGGEAGLDEPVRWVHSSELLDPTPWLSGGEILLTTGMQLTDADRQRAFVARLHDHGLAGIGVGTGFAHDTVPVTMVQEADARGFAIFEVPYELPFIAITERAFGHIVNEQYELLRRSISAQERLQRIVLSERGLPAIAGALAASLGGAVVVLDGRGEVIASHEFRRRLSGEQLALLGSDAGAIASSDPELAARTLVLDIAPTGQGVAAGPPQAWLVSVKDSGAHTDADRLLLQQGVTAVAFELLRLRVADTTARRLAGDVLVALARGDLAGSELQRRLEPFGLGGEVGALVLHAGESRAAAERLELALETALHAETPSGLVAVHGDLVCALLPGAPDDELFGLAERVLARVVQDTGTAALPAGAGRAAPAGRRARDVPRSPLRGGGPHAGAAGTSNGDAAAPADHLPRPRILRAAAVAAGLRRAAPVLRVDARPDRGRRGPLRRRARALARGVHRVQRPVGGAARRLFCHRHTLRYRMRKVEELTGRDLSSARDRIEFWLALRGRELV